MLVDPEAGQPDVLRCELLHPGGDVDHARWSFVFWKEVGFDVFYSRHQGALRRRVTLEVDPPSQLPRRDPDLLQRRRSQRRPFLLRPQVRLVGDGGSGRTAPKGRGHRGGLCEPAQNRVVRQVLLRSLDESVRVTEPLFGQQLLDARDRLLTSPLGPLGADRQPDPDSDHDEKDDCRRTPATETTPGYPLGRLGAGLARGGFSGPPNALRGYVERPGQDERDREAQQGEDHDQAQ